MLYKLGNNYNDDIKNNEQALNNNQENIENNENIKIHIVQMLPL